MVPSKSWQPPGCSCNRLCSSLTWLCQNWPWNQFMHNFPLLFSNLSPSVKICQSSDKLCGHHICAYQSMLVSQQHQNWVLFSQICMLDEQNMTSGWKKSNSFKFGNGKNKKFRQGNCRKVFLALSIFTKFTTY